jgi:hypothetical protein
LFTQRGTDQRIPTVPPQTTTAGQHVKHCPGSQEFSSLGHHYFTDLGVTDRVVHEH